MQQGIALDIGRKTVFSDAVGLVELVAGRRERGVVGCDVTVGAAGRDAGVARHIVAAAAVVKLRFPAGRRLKHGDSLGDGGDVPDRAAAAVDAVAAILDPDDQLGHARQHLLGHRLLAHANIEVVGLVDPQLVFGVGQRGSARRPELPGRADVDSLAGRLADEPVDGARPGQQVNGKAADGCGVGQIADDGIVGLLVLRQRKIDAVGAVAGVLTGRQQQAEQQDKGQSFCFMHESLLKQCGEAARAAGQPQGRQRAGYACGLYYTR